MINGIKTQDNYYLESKCCGFVTKKESKENRKGIFDILSEVNVEMKNKGYPGFSFSLVGSSRRNMVFIRKDRNFSENSFPYDHDIQIRFNSKENPISNVEGNLRKDFMNTLQKICNNNYSKYNWRFENSKSVITLKKRKRKNGKMIEIASFDIALIDIRNNKIFSMDKKNNSFLWNEIKEKFDEAERNAKKIKNDELKKEYLKLKCNNSRIDKGNDEFKSSSSLFVEAVSNIKDRTNF